MNKDKIIDKELGKLIYKGSNVISQILKDKYDWAVFAMRFGLSRP